MYTLIPSPKFSLPSKHGQVSVAFEILDAYEIDRLNLPVGVPEDLGRVSSKRLSEYMMGRLCAYKALKSLSPLLTGVVKRRWDRSPIWPPSYVGSITHTRSFASAIAVPTSSSVTYLGIDSEETISQETLREIESQVMSEQESQQLKTNHLNKKQLVTLVFSAKESIFKCLYPNVGRIFDFHDVEIYQLNIADGKFHFRVVCELSALFAKGFEGEGQFYIDHTMIHTLCFC